MHDLVTDIDWRAELRQRPLDDFDCTISKISLFMVFSWAQRRCSGTAQYCQFGSMLTTANVTGSEHSDKTHLEFYVLSGQRVIEIE
jgi:hypothetical protein